MIEFRCQSCQALFRVSSDKQGKRAKCPKCSEVTLIPSSSAPAKLTPTVAPAVQPSASLVASLPAAAASPVTGPQAAEPKVRKPKTAAPPASPGKPAAPDKPKRPRNEAQIRNAIMGGFRGSFEHPETHPLYLLNATLVAVVMLILPLVYLSIIGGVLYAVYLWHEAFPDDAWGDRPLNNLLSTLIYFFPPTIAMIFIMFLIKPLFAPAAEVHRTRSLSPENDPLLFEFVAKICEMVDAPVPTRIDVDDQMNASAGFRNGLYSIIQGNDLVLTIGAPLVAGLTTQQFAGVLAHEFGHFSQGAGMRMTYIVRRISHWFARVAYERDVFDDWLWHIACGLHIKLGIFLFAFLFLVWIVRTILWVFMYVGIFASGFLLRQMEYDADQYEIRLAGSTAFRHTSFRLRLVNMVYGKMVETLSQLVPQGAMVDDLTSFLRLQLKKMPESFRQEVRESVDKERTGFFDTHPCDRQRVAAAIAENRPGVFHHEGQAVELFRDFERLSQAVTWDRYCDVTGEKLDLTRLTPSDQLIEKYKIDIFQDAAHHPFGATAAAQRVLATSDRIPLDD